MIYLIYGENAYLRECELQKIITSGNSIPERIDASTLTKNALADIIRGGSLFGSERLIILRDISNNADMLATFAEWATEVPHDTTIVLIEQKLDKRTKAYKSLIKVARVITVDSFSERDMSSAEAWLYALAKQHEVTLTPQQVNTMVVRALISSEKSNTRVVDQMQLVQAIRAFAGADGVTDDMIATVLPQSTADTVFDLLDIATRRQIDRLTILLAELAHTDDGHGVCGLLYSQWSQLVAIILLGGSSQHIATELGIHPYVAKKLQETGKHFNRRDLQVLTQLAADLDSATKRSEIAPWDAAHRFLYAIASRP